MKSLMSIINKIRKMKKVILLATLTCAFVVSTARTTNNDKCPKSKIVIASDCCDGWKDLKGQYSITGKSILIQNGNSKHYSEPKKTNTLKQNDIKDAVAYLNQFLNDETWLDKVNGNFTYNSMFKSLAFKSKWIFKNEKESIIEEEFILNLDNIKYIKEIVHKANKTENINFIVYEFNLNDDIYYKKYTKEKGAVIPDYKNSKVNKVSVDFSRSLTEQDLTNIQRAVRVIFSNIQIETENL